MSGCSVGVCVQIITIKLDLSLVLLDRYISFLHLLFSFKRDGHFVKKFRLYDSHRNTLTKNRISFPSPVSQKAAELLQRAFIF